MLRHYLLILQILQQPPTPLFHKKTSHRVADNTNDLTTLKDSTCLRHILLTPAFSAMTIPFAHGIHTHVARLGIHEDKTSIGTSDYTYATIANSFKQMLESYSKLIFIIIIHIMYY
jgi:hypothetical protein